MALRPMSVLYFTATLQSRGGAMAGKDKSDDPMRQIRVEKLVLDISVGECGDCLTRVANVMEQLTEQQPVFSKCKDQVFQRLP